MSVSFKKVGVVGSGQMGSGIAQVLASIGVSSILYDVQPAALEKAQSLIEKSLAKLKEKGKIEQEPKDILSRLSFSQDLSAFKDCDLVIEAATENFEVKKKIFQQLMEFCSKNAAFATNTSSISITRLASETDRPENFIGIHFMNPVPLMRLVEIIPGILTQESLINEAQALVQALAKTSVVSRDYPGFIVNRILMPMINEAAYALYENIASAQDIDSGMKLGTNQPMGPLELADFIGLDTCLAIMEVLHEGLGDSKYRPCPLLKNMVAAGCLGRKTKRGFYTYEV